MLGKRHLQRTLIKTLFIASISFCTGTSHAKEGMWVPATLKRHEADMRKAGLEIPVEKIYNENGTGLNNAVVLFGKGCTGEIISSKGLVLTNHHCGYGTVQGVSAPDKDYFAYGFFARNMQEEIPCPGLTVTFIRRMENVTARILKDIADTLTDNIRDTIIARRIAATEKEFATTTHLDATIKPYFHGNQYWVAITETYRDIRLVGFPPNGIGTFGGDVENWIWPRHTGDFSLFRVYAGNDNKPADYASSNKPYHGQYFTLNISGYKEGDYTMVYGFPGTTQEYISSFELKQVQDIIDPISIEARTRKLDVWTKHMNASRDIFLKYTSKRASVANGWKKWQGEVVGLKMNAAVQKKQGREKVFQLWADKNNKLPYARTILPQMSEAAYNVDNLIYTDQYLKECILAIELVQQGAALEKFAACYRLNISNKELNDTLKKVAAGMAPFYKNYDIATDKDVFVSLMALYFSKCPDMVPAYYKKEYANHNDDFLAWAEDVYRMSKFTSMEKLEKFIVVAQPKDSSVLMDDPAWLLYTAINNMRKQKITPALKNYYTQMRYLNRLYMKTQMAKNNTTDYYPDANLTLRVTYGQVKGLDPDGPATYSYQTNLADVVALDDPASDIFKVPAKLKDLYNAKDYGRWGVNGSMPVAFVAANHTSGGNSGSPVLNSRGELIGTNFDRAYEGTMSDYYFDPDRCRNISVDIRYTLFIIEKFGGAGWLIDEMKIVNTPVKTPAVKRAVKVTGSPSTQKSTGTSVTKPTTPVKTAPAVTRPSTSVSPGTKGTSAKPAPAPAKPETNKTGSKATTRKENIDKIKKTTN